MQTIATGGMPSPTEPDWSPDGKWIAFTAQYRSGFQICVVPAEGGTGDLARRRRRPVLGAELPDAGFRAAAGRALYALPA